jgi:hypothetical protein
MSSALTPTFADDEARSAVTIADPHAQTTGERCPTAVGEVRRHGGCVTTATACGTGACTAPSMTDAKPGETGEGRGGKLACAVHHAWIKGAYVGSCGLYASESNRGSVEWNERLVITLRASDAVLGAAQSREATAA